MKKNVHFVAIDVDDNKFHGAIVDKLSDDIRDFQSAPSASALVKKIKSQLPGKKKIKICYEATHLGFSLARDLQKMGFDCEVIAPSLVPKKPGRRQKTNKIDARDLAVYYRNGLLTPVHIPDFDEEMDRDLIRSRKFFVKTQTSIKNHITSLCKRVGWHYKQETKAKSYWTKAHFEWLEKKIESCTNSTIKINLKLLQEQLKQLSLNIELYDTEIENLAATPKYEKKVEALTCFKGIDICSAMTLTTEIGDAKRFEHPRGLTSFAGMDICEYSTGTDELKFGISKQGNKRILTTVIEACQFAFSPPKISKKLKEKRKRADPKYIEIADRCMHRLYKKGTRLIYAGKHRNNAKVACAREMLGFVWEALLAAS